MAHLRDKDGHARTFVVEIQIKLHVVAQGIEHVNVLTYLLTGNHELLQFPLYAHKEHTVLTVNILIQIDNVALIVGDELGHFRNNALTVRTMKQQYGCWFHYYYLDFYLMRCKGNKKLSVER